MGRKLQFWLANGGERVHSLSVVSTIVSRDRGKTWLTGEIIYGKDGLENPNETCAVQLDDGTILLNIRHTGKPHYRAISVSPDGLRGFSTPVFDFELPDPICYGGIAKSNKLSQNYIVFSNCATRPCRENYYSLARRKLTLRLSLDNCKIWKYSRLLEECSGYSDVAFSKDNKWIYCFYEHDVEDENYKGPKYLTFARVNLEWISDGEILDTSAK